MSLKLKDVVNDVTARRYGVEDVCVLDESGDIIIFFSIGLILTDEFSKLVVTKVEVEDDVLCVSVKGW